MNIRCEIGEMRCDGINGWDEGMNGWCFLSCDVDI